MQADGDDYGLEQALEELSKEGVLGQLCQVVSGVRHTNADRQEPLLGDDNVSLGTLNYRNIINQLDRHYDGRATVRAVRPQNAFQLLVRGYTVSVYGLPTSDPQAIAWTTSGVKRGLAAANSALVGDKGYDQPLTFDDVLFEDGLAATAGLTATHVIVVHWADQDASVVRMWAGFSRDNSKGGSPWLELVELSGYGDGGSGGMPATDGDPGDQPAGGFQAGQLPEVEIGWMPAAEPDTGSAQGA